MRKIRFLLSEIIKTGDSPLIAPKYLIDSQPVVEIKTISDATLKKIDIAFENRAYGMHKFDCPVFDCHGCDEYIPDKIVGSETLERIYIKARAVLDKEWDDLGKELIEIKAEHSKEYNEPDNIS